MDWEDINRVLNRAMYYVVDAYGGAPDLLSLMADLPDSMTLQEQVHRLLSHRGGVHVVSPWGLTFPLYEGTEAFGYESASIVPNIPYSVHTWEGDLLYKVVEHQGWFGHSVLDKTLVLQSLAGQMYYLQYTAYEGKVTRLLLVNNMALSDAKALNNPALVPPPIANLEVLPQQHSITLHIPMRLRGQTISLYSLTSAPVGIPNLDQVKGNGIRELIYLSDMDALAMFYPKESAWFCAFQGSTPLSLANVRGTGVDRFTPATNYLWYIAIGKELNTLLVRPGVNRIPPEYSLFDVIKVEVDLL